MRTTLNLNLNDEEPILVEDAIAAIEPKPKTLIKPRPKCSRWMKKLEKKSMQLLLLTTLVCFQGTSEEIDDVLLTSE